MGLLRDTGERPAQRLNNLVRNAQRVADTLGELKGAAMKVGQMASLHDGLLPPEVAAILSVLQREAPSVPFEVMEYELRGELPQFDELFASLEPEAFAAASIGQVHRGVLRDGRHVAVKIQYPEIDRIIRSDIKNLKRVMGSLIGMFTSIDLDPIWEELGERLLEEVDYLAEARNVRRMADLHVDIPEIVVPAVIEEATTRRVLTTEYVEGLSAEAACMPDHDQGLRDRWGVVLAELTLRGLLQHGLLHADPNLANFAFLEDGRVIVYDYGCMKAVPATLATGYARLTLSVADDRNDEIPDILVEMGMYKGEKQPLPRVMTDPYAVLFREVVRENPPYRFGEDPSIYTRIMELGLEHWSESLDLHIPKDAIFVNRTLAGHFGNLCRLNASGPWRQLILGYAEAAARSAPSSPSGAITG